MKKNVRSLLVLLCAALLLCAAALPAFAAGEAAGNDDQTGTGTITITNAVAGKTYTLYRIFDLESHSGDNFSYKMNASWSEKSFDSNPAFTNNFEIKAGGYVYKKDTYNETVAADFAKAALSFAKTNSIAAVDSKTSDAGGSLVFSNLQLGYYLVDSSVGALCSLTTPADSVEIQEKNTVPTIEKTILENNASTTSNVAKIGDEVHYQVTIHAKKGAENYVMTDTLSAGLTFNNNVTVTVNGTALSSDYYTVSAGADNTFTVTFSKTYLDTIAGDTDIVVAYSATLNEKAVVDGNGNGNSVSLKYGNDHTVTSETTTYSRQFDLVKTDSNNKLLAGAFFKLYTDKTAGTEIPLKKIDSHTYRVAVEGDTSLPIETVSDGKITIQGLSNGTYWLEETQNPEGYNKLEARVEVALAGGSLTSSMTGTTWSENDSGVHIVNQSGTVLPGTGGRGTTLFYVVGGGLMFAAIVLLVAKKRMEHKD